jgi:DNA-binding LytR/AlgR family response regulator
MMKCIAVDDEPLALEVIRKYTADTPLLQLLETFTDAIQALSFLKTRTVDLIILDIHMPDISGIQLIQSLKDPPMVIFTTAYSEYAVKGFELQAVDYLVKPVRFERFMKAVEKAARIKELMHNVKPAPEEDCIFVKSGYGQVRVNLSDIRYIEGLDDYLKIHRAGDAAPVLSQTSLKSILEKLPADRFMRVHRSFIVSLKHIRYVRKKTIRLEGVDLPVGDTYAGDVINWLLRV